MEFGLNEAFIEVCDKRKHKLKEYTVEIAKTTIIFNTRQHRGRHRIPILKRNINRSIIN